MLSFQNQSQKENQNQDQLAQLDEDEFTSLNELLEGSVEYDADIDKKIEPRKPSLSLNNFKITQFTNDLRNITDTNAISLQDFSLKQDVWGSETILKNNSDEKVCSPSIQLFNLVHNASSDAMPQDSPTNAFILKKDRSPKAKIHQQSPKIHSVNINDDIQCFERLERIVPKIKENHNRICPFCRGYIDLKKSNFQNISAFCSQKYNKFFLTHFDCLLRSNTNPQFPKIKSIVNLPKCINHVVMNPSVFDSSNYFRDPNHTFYTVIWEMYHPISSLLFSRIEKFSFVLEHVTQPNMYILPFYEFRVQLQLFSSKEEEPYDLEFYIDLTDVKFSEARKHVDIYYNNNGNSLIFGVELIYDQNNEVMNYMNFKVNIAPITTINNYSAPGTPMNNSFGNLTPKENKYTYCNFKYMIINLPLKKLHNNTNGHDIHTNNPYIKVTEDPQVQNISQLPTVNSLQQINYQLGHTIQQNIVGKPIKQKSNFHQQQQQQQIPQRAPPGFSNLTSDFNKLQINNSKISIDQSNLLSQPVVNNTSLHQFINTQSLQHLKGQQQVQQLQENQKQQQQQETKKSLKKTLKLNSQSFVSSFSNNKNEGQGIGVQEIQQTQGSQYSFSEQQPKQENLYQSEIIQSREDDQKYGQNSYESQIKARIAQELNMRRVPSQDSFISSKDSHCELDSSLSINYGVNHKVSTLSAFSVQKEDDLADAPEIENILNYKAQICSLAKSHQGSRMLQRFLTHCNQNDNAFVLEEINFDLKNLMMDAYANFIFKNLMQNCTYEQRFNVLLIVLPDIVEIACDKRGTHALQAVIGLVSSEKEEIIIKEQIEQDIFNLILDQYGTHLVQKIIYCFHEKNTEFISQTIYQYFLDIANNPRGLCVLKAYIYKFKSSPQKRYMLVRKIQENAEHLLQDPYGNYAIQYALENFDEDTLRVVYDLVLEKVVQLSIQKYSSNVVEKCLQTSSLILKDLFLRTMSQGEIALEMMKNKYGNFVLIKALKLSQPEQYEMLLFTIKNNIELVNIPKYKAKWQSCLGTVNQFDKMYYSEPNLQFGFDINAENVRQIHDFSMFFRTKKFKN